MPPKRAAGPHASYGGREDGPTLMQQLQQMPIKPNTKQKLVKSFKMFDQSGDGFLDREESYAAMMSFLPNVDAVELNDIVLRADADGDGKISIIEWAQLAGPYLLGRTKGRGSGSDSGSDKSKGSSSDSDSEPDPHGYRKRMVNFYLHYAPEKLDGIDRALARYRGREEEMFARLVQKYGPEPPAQPPVPPPSAPEPVATPVQPVKPINTGIPPEGTVCCLVPQHNQGVVLDVSHVGTHNGAKVHMWGPTGAANQKWRVHHRPNGTISFHPMHAPHMALDMTGVLRKHNYIWGARDDFVNQSFNLEAVPGQPGVFWIKWNDWYLDVDYGGQGSGGGWSKVHAWHEKTGAANQMWVLGDPAEAPVLTPPDGFICNLVPQHNQNMVVDVSHCATHAGAKIHLWTQTGAGNQKWRIHRRHNGTIAFHPMHAPNMALDMTGAIRGQCHLWGADPHNDNQAFVLEAVPGKQNVYWIKAHLKPNMYLDIDLGHGKDGAQWARLHTWEKTGAPNQQFLIRKAWEAPEPRPLPDIPEPEPGKPPGPPPPPPGPSEEQLELEDAELQGRTEMRVAESQARYGFVGMRLRQHLEVQEAVGRDDIEDADVAGIHRLREAEQLQNQSMTTQLKLRKLERTELAARGEQEGRAARARHGTVGNFLLRKNEIREDVARRAMVSMEGTGAAEIYAMHRRQLLHKRETETRDAVAEAAMGGRQEIMQVEQKQNRRLTQTQQRQKLEDAALDARAEFVAREAQSAHLIVQDRQRQQLETLESVGRGDSQSAEGAAWFNVAAQERRQRVETAEMVARSESQQQQAEIRHQVLSLCRRRTLGLREGEGRATVELAQHKERGGILAAHRLQKMQRVCVEDRADFAAREAEARRSVSGMHLRQRLLAAELLARDAAEDEEVDARGALLQREREENRGLNQAQQRQRLEEAQMAAREELQARAAAMRQTVAHAGQLRKAEVRETLARATVEGLLDKGGAEIYAMHRRQLLQRQEAEAREEEVEEMEKQRRIKIDVLEHQLNSSLSQAEQRQKLEDAELAARKDSFSREANMRRLIVQDRQRQKLETLELGTRRDSEQREAQTWRAIGTMQRRQRLQKAELLARTDIEEGASAELHALAEREQQQNRGLSWRQKLQKLERAELEARDEVAVRAVKEVHALGATRAMERTEVGEIRPRGAVDAEEARTRQVLLQQATAGAAKIRAEIAARPKPAPPAPAPPPPALFPPDGFVCHLVPQHNEDVVVASAQDSANRGTKIHMGPVSSSAGNQQQWKIRRRRNGTVSFHPMHATHMALDMIGGVRNQCHIWDAADGNHNQSFALEPVPGKEHVFWIKSHIGVYLDVDLGHGKDGGNGAMLHSWEKTGAPNQMFLLRDPATAPPSPAVSPARSRLPPEGTVVHMIPMHNPSLVIDVAGNAAHNGAKVHMWGPTGAANQKWRVHHRPNGTISFHPMHAPHTAFDMSGVLKKQNYIWGARDHFVNQSFNLEAVPGQPGVFWIKWNDWFLTVDMSTGGGAQSTLHCLAEKTGADNQKFLLQDPAAAAASPSRGGVLPSEGTVVEIVCMNNESVVFDVAGSAPHNGAKVHAAAAAAAGGGGAGNQRWQIRRRGLNTVALHPLHALDKALDDANGLELQVQIWQTDVRNNNQTWAIEPVAGKQGVCYIRSSRGGYVTMQGAGQQAVLDTRRPKTGAANQHFKLVPHGSLTLPPHGSIVQLVPMHNQAMVADVTNQNPSQGAKIQMWTVTGAANQKWRVHVRPDGFYCFRPMHATSMALDMTGGVRGHCHIWAADEGSANQAFVLEPVPGQKDVYWLKSSHGCYLDVDLGNGKDGAQGAKLHSWEKTGAPNQMFHIRRL